MERKTSLYFSRRAGEVFMRGKSLVISEGAEKESETPLARIRRVVLLGRAEIGTALLYRLMRAKIPVDWLDIFGKPLGQLLSQDEDLDKYHSRQMSWLAEPEAFVLARQILLAKIDNCHEILRRRLEPLPRWNEERKALAAAESPESLRGEEGALAHLYFSHWQELLHGFQWEGRKAHPAPDPVNMLLSLGYSLLYNRLSSALRNAGLNPRLGFFHEIRGSHCALTSDLMEPFRALVDSTVLTIIRRGEIRPENFERKGGRCACADNKVFAKLLLIFEEMFSGFHKFYYSASQPDQYLECSLNDCLDEYAESFALHLLQGTECFLPRLTKCPAI